MAPMYARGSAVRSSEEGELLACRKAVEFAIDAGFSMLVIEGDNVYVIKAISLQEANISLLGNVMEDIKHLIRGLRWVSISHTRRSGNQGSRFHTVPASTTSIYRTGKQTGTYNPLVSYWKKYRPYRPISGKTGGTEKSFFFFFF